MKLAIYKGVLAGVFLVIGFCIYYYFELDDYCWSVRINKQTLLILPPTLPPVTIAISIVEFNQYIILHQNRTKGRDALKLYVGNLTALKTGDMIKHFGVSNLTSEISQRQFLSCSGSTILQKLPLHVPPSHQRCRNMTFQSAGPIVALGSFPGSGNSWVRELLESATGIYTGAVYCDGSFVAAGMIGEGVTTENVIAVKSHDSPSKTKSHINHTRAIYIVRSPFRSFLSEHIRYITKEWGYKNWHTAEIDYDYANDEEWKKLIKKKSFRWKRTIKQWLNVTDYPVLFVGYENLVNNTYNELKRMLDFIGYPYSESDVLCAVNTSGIFHRSHKKKNPNPYTQQIEKIVLNQIKAVDAQLKIHNISLYHPYHHIGVF